MAIALPTIDLRKVQIPQLPSEQIPVFGRNDPGLAHNRLTTYQVDRLNNAEERLEPTSAEIDGTLTWDAYAAVKGGGQMSIRFLGAEYDWLQTRFKVSITVQDLETYREQTYPVGVFLPAAPTREWAPEGATWKIDLLDKLSILDSDIMTHYATGKPYAYTVPKGYNVMSAVTQIIAQTGEAYPALQPSTKVLAAAMVWDVGTTRLKIINDLLTAAGFASLWCDGQGQFRTDEYVLPVNRPPTYEIETPFAYGEGSLLSPQWTQDRDIYAIPNRYVLVGQGDGSTPPWISMATNTNPVSPFSYPRRGRWITVSEIGVEAVSQADLDRQCAARLSSATSVTEQIKVRHPFLPDLQINDVVRFTDPRATMDSLCFVTNTSIPLNPLGLCETTLMETLELQ